VPALRVTAGALRGRRIPLPGGDLRPTSERARQAFFNILGDRVEGARFLDLFAGSGIFSFEAVSRGAASAIAVDSDRRKVEAINRRAKEWKAPVKAIGGDAVDVLSSVEKTPFDVVYADPPYDYPRYDDLLRAIDSRLPLAPGAIVAIEHRRRTDPLRGETRRLRHLRRTEYGEVSITLFEHDATLA
jgi:16S rRNA (guanine966-N2)-methyltransferase